ncbi:ABC-type sugar transport system, permease component [Nonomuraea solani]|uniref:ABC-type sugar transport system, permease component n=1 Tax=Nonomuraea solani TaxID=1144553 RepID=A0A1H6E0Q0_9ACTN|nr:sugar ABC transporter permease [Nonomuraea solani]SEG90733.1 ABC-type sugar transport system, permease component [Nonomuraea solani]
MTSPTPAFPAPPQAFSRALGWLLAVPALLGTLISLVLPTVQTIWLSFQSGGVMRASAYVGADNYTDLFGEDEFWRALGFTLSLTLIPLLVAVIAGPLLALALDRAGTWPRRAGYVVLSLAIVTFSPVGVAAAWMRGLMSDASGITSLAEGLREPATAPGTLRLIVAAATFGVVCALAVIAFLPALRGGTVAPAMLAVGALVVLATVAVGLQSFSVGMVLTRGGPERSTETLAGLQYDYAFRMAQLGPGASIAVLTGVILGALGIIATVIAAASRLRITLTSRTETGPHGAGPSPFEGPKGSATASGPAGSWPAAGIPGPRPAEDASGSWAAPGAPAEGPAPVSSSGSPGAARRGSAGPVGVVVGVVALVVFTGAGLLCAWPWIDGVLASPGSPAGSLRVHMNTWVPALAGALVSVGVAYLAALGIGGLRPLGRGSEWLLLAFAPWLFVGAGPLGNANWQNVRNLGLIDSFLALFPPLLVSVPALLVLTLLCKGLAERAGRDFFGGVFVPSLPMAGILAGAVTLVNAHDLLWPMLVVQKPGLYTAPVAQVAQLNGFSSQAIDVGATTPVVVVAIALAALVAAQVFYLDRLAIATKGSR